MADRAAARSPLLARRRIAVVAYATVGLCQCGVACAAPLSLARPGQESASVHGSNGTPDGAKPVRPLLLLLLPVPERRMRMRLQTDGSGGNDDSREDMHGETQSSRRRTQRWGGLAACHCQREQLRPEGCSCTAPRNGTQHQCNAQLQHTRYCACAWSI